MEVGTSVSYGAKHRAVSRPARQVTLRLRAQYLRAGSTALASIWYKPIHNFVRAAYQVSALGDMMVQSFPVTVGDLRAGSLPVQPVSKSTSARTKVHDGTARCPTRRRSAIPGSQAFTAGTLIDTLHIAPVQLYDPRLPVPPTAIRARASPAVV